MFSSTWSVSGWTGLLAGLVWLHSAIAARGEERTTLRGHVPRVVARLQASGRLPADTNLDLAIGLPLRNRQALTNLLDQLYDPAGTNYHKFLTSAEFTRRFGPTEADYQAVMDFARTSGFLVTGTHANRVLLDVRASVGRIETAFRTVLRVYPRPAGAGEFYSPEIEPSVPSGVPIQDLSGLDNFEPPHPLDLRLKAVGREAGGVVVTSNATGSGPGGDFTGKDFRAAYAPGVTNDGAGQIIGLFEFGPYYTNDIYRYETNAGLPTTIVVSNVLLNGVSGVPAGTNADDGEEALDIDMALSMAPGATVLVYEGNNGNDIFNRMASDNLARQMSCSFGYSPMPASTEQIFQQFAAQGQSMFVASGDGGAYPFTPGAISPQAEDPYLTIVGGTSLTTGGPGGAWISESAWGGSGGGTSTRWGIPGWQAGISMQSNLGSATLRNIPDVAMLADTVIFWFLKNGSPGTVGGTSAAAPLWAGFTALINQEAARRGQPPIGFLNPAIYALGKGPVASYRTAFHDIVTGSNHKYDAVAGYDLCTGWGTPTGSNTINALLGTGTKDFTLYASPGLPPFVRGSAAVTTITVLPMSGFSGPVNLSVSNLPAGVSATLSSSITTTTSVLTLTSSNTAPTGSFSPILIGSSGGLTHVFPLTLSIEAPVPGEIGINISSFYNRSGFYTDGARFSGGADGVGFGYPATLLGRSPGWNGVLFALGPGNALDLISSLGQTIGLPSGQYTVLHLLAAGVNGSQLNQVFTVTYTDNSTDTINQSLSDWANPNNFAGESIAVGLPYRNSGGGTPDTGTAVNVYGYSFALNPSKTVRSVRLPNNGNVLVLAMTLANSPAPVALASAYNRVGFYPDGTTFATTGGLDGGGSAYSAAWLGGAQEWNGIIFHFGPANASNAVACSGQTLRVPPGQYLSLALLATGVRGNQNSQSFVATYSDGTTATRVQNLSDWFTPQNFAGETKALIMGYRNTSSGSKDNRTFYLYGYSLPLNSSKTLQSIRLPNNANVEILALSLVPNLTLPPLITATVALQGTNAVLSWSGSAGPCQVQITTDLGNPNWQPFGTPLSTNTLVFQPTNGSAFYRIVGP